MATPSGSHKSQHSLRKSEQISQPRAPRPAPPADSKLPSQRRGDEELQAIRRRQALAQLTPVENPRFASAHVALLILGYLGSLASAAAFYFYDASVVVSAPCAVVSLLIAAFITLKKPLSRHHAAFIMVITLFVIIFGALHYIP